MENDPIIVKTDIGNKDGQDKCPRCGSSEISLNTHNGLLRCNYCRFEFEAQHVEGLENDISNLQGETYGSGTQDIDNNFQDALTLKCTSCGAEVVIDTSEVTQARCHWCRNTLSINQQIPNGSVPDVVLPFKVDKNEARSEIEKFVGKRKFFAHPQFKREFTTENIMGVYFPYMVVDVNGHSSLSGQGEHLVKSYSVGSGSSRRTYYDADLYDVGRDFDVAITGLTVESSSDKLNVNNSNKTTNIINSIMPFDTENAVKWNSNYLRGFSSEKRDTNVDQLKPLVHTQSQDVARFAANKTLSNYDRGVNWHSENFSIKGEQWKSAYLPVWLYSYHQKKGTESVLHYVAVNARTKETMGSVPIHMPKLIFISILVELLGIFLAFLLYDPDDSYSLVLLLAGIIYFFIMHRKYRNSDARHYHESETKSEISNLRQYDNFIKHEKRLSNPQINGANNTRVNGSLTAKKNGFEVKILSNFDNQFRK